MYQFILGFAKEALGGVSVDRCLPDGWKSETGDAKEDEANLDTNVTAEKSNWEKILGYIGTAVDVVCLVKDFLEDVKQTLIDMAKDLVKRYIRLFLQGKTKRTFSLRAMWWGSDAWNWIKDAAKKTGKYIAKAAASVQKAIGDVINSIFTKVIEIFDAMKAKLTKFFSGPIMSRVVTVVKCVTTAVVSGSNVLELMKKFAEKVELFASFPVGFMGFVIGLICKYKDFKEAIDFLKKAWTSTDAAVKFFNFGSFLGKIANIIVTA